MRKQLLTGLSALGLLAATAAIAEPGGAADHLEAPLVQQDGRTDINDIYAFQSPDNPKNTVLIMTVNPGAGVISGTTFDPEARYRFQIDNDGDARKDETITVRFGKPDEHGNQRVTARLNGHRARGWTGDTIDFAHGKLTTGTFDDPFFFDFTAFQDQVKGAGGTRTFCDGGETDFFAGLDVSAIVIEVPSKKLTKNKKQTQIGVWGETSAKGQGRIDSMGRPAIATVLIDDGSEDRFNRTRPHKHAQRFDDQVEGNLLFLSGLDGSGYTEAEAEGIADILLPDILTVDTASADGFVPGLNGRGLADDVIDLELFIVTGGLGANGSAVLDSDCVDANDVPFPGTFPYLAPSHR